MTILVIDAGGTIGSATSAEGLLKPCFARPGTNLVQDIARANKINVMVMSLEKPDGHVAAPLDSASWNSEQWQTLSAMIDRYAYNFRGIVVLHGTDTICYTATALTLALKRPLRPVILTGSMLPPAHASSDARDNIHLALSVASGLYGDLTDQIVIAADGKIMLGAYAVKDDATGRSAFNSPRMPTLTRKQSAATRSKVIAVWRRNRFSPVMRPRNMFSRRVIDIGLGPNTDHENTYRAIMASEAKAVLFRCYPSGVPPTSVELGRLANRLHEMDVTSLAVSSARKGLPNWNTYELGHDLAQSRLINAILLSPETGYVLLSWAVGNSIGPAETAEIARQLTVAIR